MRHVDGGAGGAPFSVERPFTTERVEQLAAEGGLPLPENDRQAVADLLNGLAADMAQLKKLVVGESEPAIVYRPAIDTQRGPA